MILKQVDNKNRTYEFYDGARHYKVINVSDPFRIVGLETQLVDYAKHHNSNFVIDYNDLKKYRDNIINNYNPFENLEYYGHNNSRDSEILNDIDLFLSKYPNFLMEIYHLYRDKLLAKQK